MRSPRKRSNTAMFRHPALQLLVGLVADAQHVQAVVFQLRILHPNSDIYHYVEITGNISDLCWNGDTYHNCIWNYLFYNLFPAVK